MNKPNNYDSTPAKSDNKRIEPGPHIAILKTVTEMLSSGGRPMIRVEIDFAPEDQQAGYFKEVYDADTRLDKKWPFLATHYILSEDNDGNTTRAFKSFCSAFEDSNDRMIEWGPAFEKNFPGRKIGVVYGDVEGEYQGRIIDRTRIRWFFDTHKAADQKTPDKKALKKHSEPTPAFVDFNVDGDDVPFR